MLNTNSETSSHLLPPFALPPSDTVATEHNIFVCAVSSPKANRHSYVRMQHFVRRTTSLFLFGVFGEDVRREFMQRLFATLHGTLGSYLRDAFQEGSADTLACLLFLGLRFFPHLFLFLLGGIHCFSCKNFFSYFS
jgi:hypothetical protein